MATNISTLSFSNQNTRNIFETKYLQTRSDFFLITWIGVWSFSYRFISTKMGKGMMFNYISSIYLSYFLTNTLFFFDSHKIGHNVDNEHTN
jgi:hypothetical protein